ncbi:MAG UNVERIFIED_CONTAM: hypothetical protein LVT10_06745 [Anaerolineae bacterium]
MIQNIFSLASMSSTNWDAADFGATFTPALANSPRILILSKVTNFSVTDLFASARAAIFSCALLIVELSGLHDLAIAIWV